MNSFTLPLIKKEKIADGVYSFYFDRSHQSLAFLPGQYIRMVLSIANPDERGNSRLFTIASSPLENEFIMITTKIIQSTFKKRLAEVKVGEEVQFLGPMGGFILREEEKNSRVFLAGGIGLTPFHSMIKYASLKHLAIPIVLIVSFSTTKDVFWYEEFQNIADNNPNIKVIYTITHLQDLAGNWQGETGRISEQLIKKYVTDIMMQTYYIAGPPAMVCAIEEMVETMSVPTNKIIIENFVGY